MGYTISHIVVLPPTADPMTFLCVSNMAFIKLLLPQSRHTQCHMHISMTHVHRKGHFDIVSYAETSSTYVTV